MLQEPVPRCCLGGRAGFPHGAGAAPDESPPDSAAIPARDREDGLRRLCRRDVAGEVAKAAEQS